MTEDAPPPVAVISGGASGIGQVVARALQDAGYALFVLDSNADQVSRFCEVHGEGSALVCDVSSVDQVDRAFQEFAERHQRLDVLVNNVGIAGPHGSLETLAVEDWQRTIDVDLNSLFYVTRHAIPVMKRQGAGVIINMASNAGLQGCPLRSPYTAAKWATVGLTKTWAMDLGPGNIRVNALCPGSVEGERIDGVIARDAAQRGVTAEAIRQVYQRQSSLQRFIKPESIAAMVVFLAGPGGEAISGQAVAIDGHTETLANWMSP